MVLKKERSSRFFWWCWLVLPLVVWACGQESNSDLGTLPYFYPSGNSAVTGTTTAGQTGAAGSAGMAAGGTTRTSPAAGSTARGGRGGAVSVTTGGKGGSSNAGKAGAGGKTGSGGTSSSAGTGSATATGETGRMAGMTAAHNAVRAEVNTQTPLPLLTWSPTLAAYAQEWTDSLAKTCNPQHRSPSDLRAKGYGENLAMFGATFGSGSTPQKAVDGWAGEVDCWTYGKFMTTDKCDTTCYQKMNSDGCGHYTQIVWRTTTEVGCGVSTCSQGSMNIDIWVCNYKPAGNYVGQNPY